MRILNTIICLSLVIFFACQGDKHNVPASVVNIPNSASGDKHDGLPKFSFRETEHDFGVVIQGERVTYGFKFRNTGDADLVIANISTTCGCTATNYPKTPIGPGGEDIIEVSFNSAGKEGFQHKTITVAANTQPSNTELTIKALVMIPEKRN